MDKPYVKLFTLTGKGVMKFSDEQIEFLAKNYGWINTHAGMWAKSPDAPIESPNWRYPFGKSGGDYGKRLREKNPIIILTN